MKALLGLISAVWSFVLEQVTDFVNWLRRPGSKLKLVCAVLAFAAASSGWNSYMKAHEIATLETQVVTITGECDIAKAELRAGIASRDQTLSEISRMMAVEVRKLEQLRGENSKVLRDLVLRMEAVHGDAFNWKVKYESRTPSCQVALQVLDEACPELEGY